MRTAIVFLASLASVSAFAPALPSYTRTTTKRAGPVCSAVGGSRILEPFEQRRALKVGDASCRDVACVITLEYQGCCDVECTWCLGIVSCGGCVMSMQLREAFSVHIFYISQHK